ESVVRVGARAVPIGELLIAAAIALSGWGGRRRRPELLAAAFDAAAAGAGGWPAAATWTLAGGLLCGGALWFLGPTPAGAAGTALPGGRRLLGACRTG